MRGVEHIPWAYDLLMEVAERCGLRRWRQQLVGEAKGRVLDLGCGTGRNLRLFAAESKVTGLELDLGLLAAARRRAPDMSLVVGRAEDLPFQSGSFDTVVSSLVFCSVADPARGLRETARILDSRGPYGITRGAIALRGGLRQRRRSRRLRVQLRSLRNTGWKTRVRRFGPDSL